MTSCPPQTAASVKLVSTKLFHTLHTAMSPQLPGKTCLAWPDMHPTAVVSLLTPVRHVHM